VRRYNQKIGRQTRKERATGLEWRLEEEDIYLEYSVPAYIPLTFLFFFRSFFLSWKLSGCYARLAGEKFSSTEAPANSLRSHGIIPCHRESSEADTSLGEGVRLDATWRLRNTEHRAWRKKTYEWAGFSARYAWPRRGNRRGNSKKLTRVFSFNMKLHYRVNNSRRMIEFQMPSFSLHRLQIRHRNAHEASATRWKLLKKQIGSLSGKGKAFHLCSEASSRTRRVTLRWFVFPWARCNRQINRRVIESASGRITTREPRHTSPVRYIRDTLSLN